MRGGDLVLFEHPRWQSNWFGLRASASNAAAPHARRSDVDTLRGAAILMMVSYHFLFDLEFLKMMDLGVRTGALGFYAYLIATMFLLLVGVSLTLSFRRARDGATDGPLFPKYARRGAKIFLLGMLVTAVTLVYPGRGFVVFGVLHCIGLSVLLAYPFLRRRLASLAVGVGVVVVGTLALQTTYSSPLLLWLGLAPHGFYTIDYFPLLPWFGVVLVGVFVGNSLYRPPSENPNVKAEEGSKGSSKLAFLGRNSLLIYLLHQPLLFAVLYPVSILI